MIIASILARATLRTGQFCREHFGESEEIAALYGTVTDVRVQESQSTCIIKTESPMIAGRGI